MASRWGDSGNNIRLYFCGLRNHWRWWLQPWNKKKLTPWKKRYDQPRQCIRRDITLPTKVRLVKAMVLPLVMYGCDSWTIKKAECWRINAFELWCWRLLKVLSWAARRSNQSILKEISPGCSLEGLKLKLKLQYFGHLMRRADSFEKTLMLGKIEGKRRRGDGGWDIWIVSLTRWTCVWLNSGYCWWAGRPGVLQSIGSQRVRHDWATELNWKGFKKVQMKYFLLMYQSLSNFF